MKYSSKYKSRVDKYNGQSPWEDLSELKGIPEWMCHPLPLKFICVKCKKDEQADRKAKVCKGCKHE